MRRESVHSRKSTQKVAVMEKRNENGIFKGKNKKIAEVHPFTNWFKCKHFQFGKQKAEIVKTNKKQTNAQDPAICCLQETQDSTKDTNMLKVKRVCVCVFQ